MYNPPRFRSDDLDEAFTLMDQNPFATVITVVNGSPVISHLPLTVKRAGDDFTLIGHLARGNPQSRSLAASEITSLFQGPHTFITPKWYVENDAPTWNYSTVHICGSVEMIEDETGILDCVRELTQQVERLWPSGWEFYIPEDLRGGVLAKSIVGFRVRVRDLNFKRKLSQSNSSADRVGVMQGLLARGDDQSLGVRRDMLKIFNERGEKR